MLLPAIKTGIGTAGMQVGYVGQEARVSVPPALGENRNLIYCFHPLLCFQKESLTSLEILRNSNSQDIYLRL